MSRRSILDTAAIAATPELVHNERPIGTAGERQANILIAVTPSLNLPMIASRTSASSTTLNEAAARGWTVVDRSPTGKTIYPAEKQ